MSRSRKRNAIDGCALHFCERADKRIWHRKMRAMCRARLHNADVESTLMPVDDEAGEMPNCRRGGKWWFDPREHPELLRK